MRARNSIERNMKKSGSIADDRGANHSDTAYSEGAFRMSSQDAARIRRIVKETNRYLNRLQRLRLLWADVDGHITASHIAESLGDTALVSRHLQAVTRLLLEIHTLEPPCPPRARSRRTRRVGPASATRHYQGPRALSAPEGSA